MEGGDRVAAPPTGMRAPLVLVVDDDPDSRAISRAMLEHHDYRVLEAAHGAEAVDRARASRPDLILMDLGLPVLDGWDAIRRLKQDPETAPIPVIALTVHTQPWDIERAQEAGCDRFLEKPKEPRELIEEIARLIPRP